MRTVRDHWRTAGLVVGVFFLAFSSWKAVTLSSDTRALFKAFQGEANERRDQTCTVFERAHLKDVEQLRNTYRYLVQLSPSERRTTLNRFVIAGLPRLEQNAHVDTAPDYCDEPGAEAERHGARPVGLPEPDPVVPDRPAELRNL